MEVVIVKCLMIVKGVLFADISGLVDTDDYRIISLNAG